MLADFDPEVVWIVSQPFLLEAVVAGQTRRDVPDFALVDRQGVITVVDVKRSTSRTGITCRQPGRARSIPSAALVPIPDASQGRRSSAPTE